MSPRYPIQIEIGLHWRLARLHSESERVPDHRCELWEKAANAGIVKPFVLKPDLESFDCVCYGAGIKLGQPIQDVFRNFRCHEESIFLS
jgi:hypothetical protein